MLCAIASPLPAAGVGSGAAVGSVVGVALAVALDVVVGALVGVVVAADEGATGAADAEGAPERSGGASLLVGAGAADVSDETAGATEGAELAALLVGSGAVVVAVGADESPQAASQSRDEPKTTGKQRVRMGGGSFSQGDAERWGKLCLNPGPKPFPG